jgi:hypothetical protein
MEAVRKLKCECADLRTSLEIQRSENMKVKQFMHLDECSLHKYLHNIHSLMMQLSIKKGGPLLHHGQKI